MSRWSNVPWPQIAVEAVAIVGSILLAFAIDAWWEEVQDERRQAQLISALVVDFETTKARLMTSIERADGLVDRSERFLQAVMDDERLPITELRHLAGGALQKIDFEPSLSAYESAVATAQIRLIENPGLLEHITDFNRARDSYELHDRITADIHYTGPMWEVRREVGSLSVLFDDTDSIPRGDPLSEEEYRRHYASPLVTGAVEAVTTANSSIAGNLRQMQDAVDKILTELESLEAE